MLLLSVILFHLSFILLDTVHVLSVGKFPSLTLNFAQETCLILILGMALRYLGLNLLIINFDQPSRFNESVDQRSTVSSNIFLCLMHVT